MEQLAASLKGLVMALSLLQVTLAQSAPIPTQQEVVLELKPIVYEVPAPVFEYHPMLKKLGMCESSNRPNIKPHLDVDGQYVYGKYQYKIATFRRHAEKYGLIAKGLTNKQIIEQLYIEDNQDKLTTLILNDGGWRNWYNCWRKIDGK